MKRIVLLVFVLVMSTFSTKANVEIEWFDGILILSNGEKLQGDINYNENLDIVSINENDCIKSFSPSKVASFEFYDPYVEEIRKYLSMEYSNSAYYKYKRFFEVVIDGKIIIVRRPNNFNQLYSISSDTFNDNYGGFIYYAYMNDEFLSLRKFKKLIMPIIKKEFEEEIEDFINSNDLNISQKETQLHLVDYYNFLADPQREASVDYLFTSTK